MECEIIFSDGTRSKGKIILARDCFSVFYKIDGDDCRLTYDGGRLIQKREGSLCLSLEFIEGRETAAELGGEVKGFIPLYCKELKITRDGDIGVYLRYDLGGEETETAATIKFAPVY